MDTTTFRFDDRDRQQLQSLGVSETRALAQLRLLQKSACFLPLERPCTLKDGVQTIPVSEQHRYLRCHEQASRAGRFQKFVPASGAATRMFASLINAGHCYSPVTRARLLMEMAAGHADASQVLQFFDHLRRYAFSEELQAILAGSGYEMAALLEKGEYQKILDLLLGNQGLGYQAAPKWRMKFHRYLTGSRTALEEHLLEAAWYVRDKDGFCRLHFTISPTHAESFQSVLNEVCPTWERRCQCQFQVSWSFQKPATDTLAMDGANRPVRAQDGGLWFRPGGHGALLENLNDLQGDFIYIKNIDNVVSERLQEPTILWKKILGGYLADLKTCLDHYLQRLHEPLPEPEFLAKVLDFAANRLGVALPADCRQWPVEQQQDYLRRRLNRPLRVCGMVKNEGEPGGGPFWVRDQEGNLSRQIVESSQVDHRNDRQRHIWQTATHFNPVDLICAVRDFQGLPFNLLDFVDQEAVFLAEKFHEGRKIKVLELPGLWNGGMAGWLTLFVEVPLATFNPVKTVFDLLRPEHQHEVSGL